MEKVLVVVPAGQAKIWDKDPEAGNVPAGQVYTSAHFKTYKNYAEQFSHNWVILSTEYGFLFPHEKISGPYSEKNNSSKNRTLVNKLRNQIIDKKLNMYDKIVGIGGKQHRDLIAKSFTGHRVRLYFPFSELSTSKIVQNLKQSVKSGEPGFK